MKNSQMMTLMEDAKLSPEELGRILGLSGMTLRRWMLKPSATLPKVYHAAVREACFSLAAEGRLATNSKAFTQIITGADSPQFDAALTNLGLQTGFAIDESSDGLNQAGAIGGLEKIGIQTSKRVAVDEAKVELSRFKKLGKEWHRRITYLVAVVGSRKLTIGDKLIAYGALFYLITPIDFIPDHIPFFGLMDDFAVLGIAAAYYAKRFSPSSL